MKVVPGVLTGLVSILFNLSSPPAFGQATSEAASSSRFDLQVEQSLGPTTLSGSVTETGSRVLNGGVNISPGSALNSTYFQTRQRTPEFTRPSIQNAKLDEERRNLEAQLQNRAPLQGSANFSKPSDSSPGLREALESELLRSKHFAGATARQSFSQGLQPRRLESQNMFQKAPVSDAQLTEAKRLMDVRVNFPPAALPPIIQARSSVDVSEGRLEIEQQLLNSKIQEHTFLSLPKRRTSDDAVPESVQLTVQREIAKSRTNGHGQLFSPPGISAVSASDDEAQMAGQLMQLQLSGSRLTNLRNGAMAANQIRGQLRQSVRVFQPLSEVSAEGRVIDWNEWHRSFEFCSRDALERSLAASNYPAGSQTFSITVGRNHDVAVSSCDSKSNRFSEAIVRAYQSLSGKSFLEFPSGSLRSDVTFFVTNDHAGGLISDINDRSLIDDHEIQEAHPANATIYSAK